MNDNYCFSVGCIVRRKQQVLLVRHTYGRAKGKLLIPGGFCHDNELPEEAAVREVFEERVLRQWLNAWRVFAVTEKPGICYLKWTM